MARREGDAVHAGDVVAELDDATYRNLRELAVARRDQAKANLALLLAGTRVEDIDQARAAVASAEADVTHAEAMFARQADLVKRNATSRQDYDDARTGAGCRPGAAGAVARRAGGGDRRPAHRADRRRAREPARGRGVGGAGRRGAQPRPACWRRPTAS